MYEILSIKTILYGHYKKLFINLKNKNKIVLSISWAFFFPRSDAFFKTFTPLVARCN